MFMSAPTARTRSLVKAVTWRMVGSLDTFMLSFIIARLFHQGVAHAATMAGSIASVETVTKVLLFYFHERVWARVPWGRADKMVVVEATPSSAPEVG
jgi:uncharacterized membrane protein